MSISRRRPSRHDVFSLTCSCWCVLWCHCLIALIDNKQQQTLDAICCVIHTLLHQAVAGLNEEELLQGHFFFFFFSPPSFPLVLYQPLSFARSPSLPHCVFASLGNDKGKWGSRLPYALPRFKLTSALIVRRDCTVEQEISFFFIGWLVTLLRLLMSKRLRSTSSRFNLTEWKVGIYLITAAQALLSAVSLPRCLDPQGSLVFDSREGRLKCSRSAPFWLAPDSLSFFLPIQYPLRSLSVTFSLFLFLSLSPPFLYICLFLGFSFVENWMTPPLPEPG